MYGNLKQISPPDITFGHFCHSSFTNNTKKLYFQAVPANASFKKASIKTVTDSFLQFLPFRFLAPASMIE